MNLAVSGSILESNPLPIFHTPSPAPNQPLSTSTTQLFLLSFLPIPFHSSILIIIHSQRFATYTVDLLNPQIFGKNDLYIDYCLFLNPFYVFLFVIISVESHLTSDCFWHPLQTYLKTPPMAGLKASILTSFGWLLETAVSTWKPLLICHDNPWL